ncbi:MAG: uracil-DNA glycosylase [Promethearchaeota archaeon]
MKDIKDIKDWEDRIPFFHSQEYLKINTLLEEKRASGESILPAEKDVFNAFKFTPFKKVKVVILGQDPYPNKRHAHGLAFSIPKSTPDIPKSLKNIFKELDQDMQIKITHGNLESWAQQGVLLLNTVLTVTEGDSNSHKSLGWQKLTTEVIQTINDDKEHCVFILWGLKAQKLKKYITNPNHYILESPHPSPLSSYRGFFGSKCFSKTNDYLQKSGLEPINWQT